MPTKTHTYRGYQIAPVQHVDKAKAGYRWYIPSVHSATGIPWDSQHCSHAVTLAQARRVIDDLIADNARVAETA